eukprot:CAMPEP_0183328168 /NCGR_PEP_ID=MMETSP0160_2-20130417/84144_1 /TAXON_ID=2839 ORGANISM="Odontella Sinensis, Strain Grunow 1884" /NCGR_SAMPLE_ID=MMETSP0160_2 /ASSEMBLY_ACC=CAM_ASM_000250 /LENGTH=254 /DNA_ID=CAMNT_0025496327 /DNA_START=10 /DNA_END=774 /DNA_ORIENTATION=+
MRFPVLLSVLIAAVAVRSAFATETANAAPTTPEVARSRSKERVKERRKYRMMNSADGAGARKKRASERRKSRGSKGGFDPTAVMWRRGGGEGEGGVDIGSRMKERWEEVKKSRPAGGGERRSRMKEWAEARKSGMKGMEERKGWQEERRSMMKEMKERRKSQRSAGGATEEVQRLRGGGGEESAVPADGGAGEGRRNGRGSRRMASRGGRGGNWLNNYLEMAGAEGGEGGEKIKKMKERWSKMKERRGRRNSEI